MTLATELCKPDDPPVLDARLSHARAGDGMTGAGLSIGVDIGGTFTDCIDHARRRADHYREIADDAR